MEEFSQSRGDDDLFDDEIVPIESSSSIPANETSQPLDSVLPNPPKQNPVPPSEPPSLRGRGTGRGRIGNHRAVGGPGGPRFSRGLADSKYAPKPQPSAQTEPLPDTPPTEAAAQTPANPSNPPPDTPTAKRTPAVRGDRSLTGGPTRAKLSENELSAKLAAAKQRSQDLAAAHARAQADKDSFDQREQVARARRANEEKRRRELEGERETNRRRKMEGLANGGGREWDQGKVEQEVSQWEEKARERDRDRVGREDLSEYLWQDGERERGRGRGRGGRGRARGRGGRGGFAANGRAEKDDSLDVSANQDFPALPGTAAMQKLDGAPQQQKPDVGDRTDKKIATDLPPSTGASWADEVSADKS